MEIEIGILRGGTLHVERFQNRFPLGDNPPMTGSALISDVNGGSWYRSLSPPGQLTLLPRRGMSGPDERLPVRLVAAGLSFHRGTGNGSCCQCRLRCSRMQEPRRHRSAACWAGACRSKPGVFAGDAGHGIG
jgi:hypothetical protein